MENKISDEKKRLLQFLEYLHIGQNSFEKIIGVSNGNIYNCKSVSFKVMQRAMEHYPQLNIVWLITGKGEMLNSPTNNLSNNNISIKSDGNNNSFFSMKDAESNTLQSLLRLYNISDHTQLLDRVQDDRMKAKECDYLKDQVHLLKELNALLKQ